MSASVVSFAINTSAVRRAAKSSPRRGRFGEGILPRPERSSRGGGKAKRGLLWSAAVLCSAAFVSPVSLFHLGPGAAGRCPWRKGQTKAAEQSTAALQTPKQAPVASWDFPLRDFLSCRGTIGPCRFVRQGPDQTLPAIRDDGTVTRPSGRHRSARRRQNPSPGRACGAFPHR
jgi:hypothetical protein